jgi:hypothetical protein
LVVVRGDGVFGEDGDVKSVVCSCRRWRRNVQRNRRSVMFDGLSDGVSVTYGGRRNGGERGT